MEPQGSLGKALDFLRQLEAAGVWYRLSSVRDALMVEAFSPGERWEVEFFDDGHVEVERFVSTGDIAGEELLPELLDTGDVTDDNLARATHRRYHGQK